MAWSPSRTPEGPTLLQDLLEQSLPWWPPLSYLLHSSGPERKQTLPGAVTWADPSWAWTEGCGGRPGKRAWGPACAQKHVSAHIDRHGRRSCSNMGSSHTARSWAPRRLPESAPGQAPHPTLVAGPGPVLCTWWPYPGALYRPFSPAWAPFHLSA